MAGKFPPGGSAPTGPKDRGGEGPEEGGHEPGSPTQLVHVAPLVGIRKRQKEKEMVAAIVVWAVVVGGASIAYHVAGTKARKKAIARVEAARKVR